MLLISDAFSKEFVIFRGGGGGLAFFFQKTWGWLTRGGWLTRASTVYGLHIHVMYSCFVVVLVVVVVVVQANEEEIDVVKQNEENERREFRGMFFFVNGVLAA